MTTQKIVSRYDESKVLFECELPEGLESGLAMRHALEKAVEAKRDLSGAYLSGANLSGAYLRDAYLSGANLSGAYLRDAYLSGAYLSGANLSGAYLRDANLRDANLRDANLSGANLRDAYLRDAYLSDAYLSGAYLSDAYLSDAYLREKVPAEKQIEALEKVRAIILDDSKRLEMGHWHEDGGWIDRTCAEETLCGTTHCLAGWLQVCSTDPGVRKMDAEIAGWNVAPVAAHLFFESGTKVLKWLEEREYVKQLEVAPVVAS